MIENRPFQHALTAHYLKQVRLTQTRFIAFVLRTINHGVDKIQPAYCIKHIDAVKNLLLAKEQGTDIILPLHTLCLALFSSYDKITESSRFKCPYLLFLILFHFKSDETFSSADSITPTIAQLVYSMRLIGIYDAQLSAHSVME